MTKHKVSTVATLNQLEELGFINTFKVWEEGIYCIESEKAYAKGEVKLCGTFRWEGMSDPDDSRVIYALETNDGTKGTIVDAFGTYATPEIGVFMDNVHDAREEMNIMQVVPAKKTIEIHVR